MPKNMIFSALLGNPHKKGFLTQKARKIENYLKSHIINRWLLLRKWSFHVFFLVNLTGSLTSSCEGVENLFIGGVLRVFSWTSWKFWNTCSRSDSSAPPAPFNNWTEMVAVTLTLRIAVGETLEGYRHSNSTRKGKLASNCLGRTNFWRWRWRTHHKLSLQVKSAQITQRKITYNMYYRNSHVSIIRFS